MILISFKHYLQPITQLTDKTTDNVKLKTAIERQTNTVIAKEILNKVETVINKPDKQIKKRRI